MHTVSANPGGWGNDHVPKETFVEYTGAELLLFLQKTRAGINLWGMSWSDMYPNLTHRITFKTPFKFLRRPFAYGDSVESILQYAASNGLVFPERVQTVADGWGTLLVPTGVFKAVRIRFELDFYFGNPQTQPTWHFVRYVWYDAAHRSPLLITTMATNSNGARRAIKAQLLLREAGKGATP